MLRAGVADVSRPWHAVAEETSGRYREEGKYDLNEPMLACARACPSQVCWEASGIRGRGGSAGQPPRDTRGTGRAVGGCRGVFSARGRVVSANHESGPISSGRRDPTRARCKKPKPPTFPAAIETSRSAIANTVETLRSRRVGKRNRGVFAVSRNAYVPSVTSSRRVWKWGSRGKQGRCPNGRGNAPSPQIFLERAADSFSGCRVFSNGFAFSFHSCDTPRQTRPLRVPERTLLDRQVSMKTAGDDIDTLLFGA